MIIILLFNTPLYTTRKIKIFLIIIYGYCLEKIYILIIYINKYIYFIKLILKSLLYLFSIFLLNINNLVFMISPLLIIIILRILISK